jgi:hypothetical protein
MKKSSRRENVTLRSARKENKRLRQENEQLRHEIASLRLTRAYDQMDMLFSPFPRYRDWGDDAFSARGCPDLNILG